MAFRYKPVLFAFFACLLLAPAVLPAVSVPAKPDGYIVDLAGIVDDRTERTLNGYLQELEQKTTAQVVALTVPSLEGETLEAFSLKVAHDQWRLGQRGKDNGVLLLVAMKERKYRIEVGYGLERVLPDSLAGSIGRTYLVPFFKKGDFAGGVAATVMALAAEVAKDAGVTITGMPAVGAPGRAEKDRGFFGGLVSVLFFIILLFFFLKNPRAFLLFFLFSSLGGRSSWRAGGGFGGGGFGSFGGGGGGGFGGGGASGGW